MTEMQVNSNLELSKALKKSGLRAGIDYWAESANNPSSSKITLRFKDRDTAILFKLNHNVAHG